MARLHISKAPLWSICPGSVSLSERVPDVMTEDRAWGIRCDEALSFTLERGGPVDITDDDEQQETAQAGVDYIREIAGTAKLHVQTQFPVTRIHEEAVARPDVWCVHPKLLHVFQFKAGHRYVEVEENMQLVGEAAAILDHLKIDGRLEQGWRVVMHVIQPRSYGKSAFREWSISATELRPHVNHLAHQADDALSAFPTCVPNDKCGDCQGRTICEAGIRAAYTGAARGYATVPIDITPHSIGAELRMLKRAQKALNARVSGLEGQAEFLLRDGKRLPFFALERSTGKLAWTSPASEVAAMGEMYGVKVMGEAKPITPTQAVKKGLPKEALEGYASRGNGGVKLVEFDDAQASKLFREE